MIFTKISHCLVWLILWSAAPCAAWASGAWWHELNDSLLNTLMAEAIERNDDVRMAEARIRQARAAYRASLGGLVPEVTLEGGWQRTQTSGRLTRTLLPTTFESYYDGRLSGTWTVDLFGQIRRKAEAQRAVWRAAQAERDVVLLTLSKEVANAYLSLCAMRRMIRVVANNIASQEEIVRLTRVRYESGLESQLDVTQALSTLHNTEAGITTYRSNEAAYCYQLALLLATTPELLQDLVVDADSLPSLPDAVTVDSTDWSRLRQRPDLRQEEWVVDQQAALLGVARKAWLPTLLIDGQIGTAAHTPDGLMHQRSWTWQVAPVIRWTVFNGGARCADIRSAQASLQEEVDRYNQLLLTAVQQVGSAAAAVQQGLQQVQSLRAAVIQAEASLRLSLELYKMGLTAFINVMQAQQSVLQYQTALVSAQSATLQQAVSLWVAVSDGIDQNHY